MLRQLALIFCPVGGCVNDRVDSDIDVMLSHKADSNILIFDIKFIETSRDGVREQHEYFSSKLSIFTRYQDRFSNSGVAYLERKKEFFRMESAHRFPDQDHRM
jgi:hypothetical protein